MHDELREDAKFAIDELRKQNKEIFIATGANKKTAYYSAKKLGIPEKNIYTGCLPIADDNKQQNGILNKQEVVRQLQSAGRKVSMIGDGPNDAAALKESCGIAVLHGETDVIALECANVIIHSASLLPLISTFVIAKQTINHVKRDLLINLAYNIAIVCMVGGPLVAAGIVINPGIGVALMVAQVCLILLLAVQFKRSQLAHVKRAEQLTLSAQSKSHPQDKDDLLQNKLAPRPSLSNQQERNRQVHPFTGKRWVESRPSIFTRCYLTIFGTKPNNPILAPTPQRKRRMAPY